MLFCLKGEAKWKVVKRLIDAYEVANMKKKVKQWEMYTL